MKTFCHRNRQAQFCYFLLCLSKVVYHSELQFPLWWNGSNYTPAKRETSYNFLTLRRFTIKIKKYPLPRAVVNRTKQACSFPKYRGNDNPQAVFIIQQTWKIFALFAHPYFRVSCFPLLLSRYCPLSSKFNWIWTALPVCVYFNFHYYILN